MPTQREYEVAVGLLHGKSATRAVCDAGYGKRYALNYGKKVASNPGVREALLEMGQKLDPVQVGRIALARLHEGLVKPPKNPKDRHAIVKTGLEVGGLIGGPNELHLHQHTTLPPAVQKMLEDKMKEILHVKGETIEGVSQAAGEGQEDHDGV
jgi:hypothetical protein